MASFVERGSPQMFRVRRLFSGFESLVNVHLFFQISAGPPQGRRSVESDLTRAGLRLRRRLGL